MSRIGKLPVALPKGTEATINGNNITVKGSKGTLSFDFHETVTVKIEDGNVITSIENESDKAMWGTTRSVIENMVEGVTSGYTKSLEINGVGYKFEVAGQKLTLSIGYSHKVDMVVPEGITAALDEKAKNVLHLSGIDKQKVGQFASKVKAKKKPEPYKGKGIRYLGEYVRRKAGKTGAK